MIHPVQSMADPCARLPFGTARWKKLGLLQRQRASSEILSRLSRFACPMNQKYGGYGMLWQQECMLMQE